MRFLKGRIDAALLSREAAEPDIAIFRHHHHGLDPLVLPVAGGNWQRFGYTDAVVIVVHLDNPIASLSFAQIDAIFSESRFRGAAPVITWGDLGVGGDWANRRIEIVGGDAWSGEETARALTIRRRILSVGQGIGRWKHRPGTGGDGEVVARVSQQPAAIGFTGRGHVRNVKVLAVGADSDEPVTLDQRSANDGSYPLLRTIDLVLSPQRNDRAVHLAACLLSDEAQAMIAEQGDFMALSPRMLALSRQRLQMLRNR